MLAYDYLDPLGRKTGIAIMSLEAGKPEKRFAIAAGPLRWTPDSRSVLHIKNESGVSNLWSQPISGGTPKQITHFNSEQIVSFDLTRDGKQLVMDRGTRNRDVVLIRDLR
jgi:Tol biopolymer transport system component